MDVSIWSIHNYMMRNPKARGRTKVPTLYETDQTGRHIAIQSNQQKGRALQDYFCPSSKVDTLLVNQTSKRGEHCRTTFVPAARQGSHTQ